MIRQVTVEVGQHIHRWASATVHHGGAPTKVDVSANVALDGSATPWLPPALVLAMRQGRSLLLRAGVDKVALRNSARAQVLLAEWYTDLQPVEVQAALETSMAPARGRGVGCFFSGGVDSFYSALELQDVVSHLIFVCGFDIGLDNVRLREHALDANRKAAAVLGKPLIEVRTNIRHLSDSMGIDWGTHFHGAAMALVGLMLADHLERVVIPASYHDDDLFPWGSHPRLDPLWSSSHVEFLHHGTHASRPKKVMAIAKQQVALDHLRVCWKNPNGAYNCGRCEKCVRTMINLRVVDALDRCATLPHEIDNDRVRRLQMGHGARLFARENMSALDDDRELRDALRHAAQVSRLREIVQGWKRRLCRGLGSR